MPRINLELPESLDREVKIYKAKKNISDKRDAIIEILKEMFSKKVD